MKALNKGLGPTFWVCYLRPVKSVSPCAFETLCKKTRQKSSITEFKTTLTLCCTHILQPKRARQLVYYSGWNHTSIHVGMSWTLERNHLRYKTLLLCQKMTPIQLWQPLLAFENSIYQVRGLPITFLLCECDKIADEPDKVRRVFNMVDNNDVSVL